MTGQSASLGYDDVCIYAVARKGVVRPRTPRFERVEQRDARRRSNTRDKTARTILCTSRPDGKLTLFHCHRKKNIIQ